jgi:hypothetical protein
MALGGFELWQEHELEIEETSTNRHKKSSQQQVSERRY